MKMDFSFVNNTNATHYNPKWAGVLLRGLQLVHNMGDSVSLKKFTSPVCPDMVFEYMTCYTASPTLPIKELL